MRDLFITCLAFSALLAAFGRPYIGLFGWLWFSIMNPHRLTWDWAFQFGFVQWLAAGTIAAWLISRVKYPLPANPPMVFWVAFYIWMGVTTLVSVNPGVAQDYFIFVTKIMVLPLFIILIVRTLPLLQATIWIVVISIGYFAVRGGVFAFITAGAYRVHGPYGSFIHDNNNVAIAILSIIPFIRYLQLTTEDKRLRFGLMMSLPLSFVAVLTTYSRGALVGLAALTALTIIRSHRPVTYGLIAVIGGMSAFLALPQSWHERMGTIQNIEEDSSAQGRFTAWRIARQIANERPLVGGGFRVLQTANTYNVFDIDETLRAAHSIVFQVLADHGYVGLTLYLLTGLATVLHGSWLIKNAGRDPRLRWARDLGIAAQTSIIAYFAGGLFLTLAYFDLIYVIMGVTIAGGAVLKSTLAEMERAPSDAEAKPEPEPEPERRERPADKPSEAPIGRLYNDPEGDWRL